MFDAWIAVLGTFVGAVGGAIAGAIITYICTTKIYERQREDNKKDYDNGLRQDITRRLRNFSNLENPYNIFEIDIYSSFCNKERTETEIDTEAKGYVGILNAIISDCPSYLGYDSLLNEINHSILLFLKCMFDTHRYLRNNDLQTMDDKTFESFKMRECYHKFLKNIKHTIEQIVKDIA